jgi:mannosyltransferase
LSVRLTRLLKKIDVPIAALAILAFVLAFHQLGDKSITLDEATSAGHARRNLIGLGSTVAGGDPNMGLYYTLLNAWYPVVGDGEVAARSLGAILAALAVPAIALLGTHLFGRPAGLAAGVLLALNAFFVQYAQTARAYGLVVLLVTLSSFFFVAELQQPSRGRRIGFVLASSAAIYAHYFSAFVLLAQLLTLLAVKRRAALTREWRTVALAVLVLCAPQALFAMRSGTGRISWIAEPVVGDLVDLPREFAGGSTLLALALGALACYATLRAFSEPERWRAGFAAAWFVIPVLLAFAVSFVQPVFLHYYLIVALPALLLLAAAGLVRLGRFAGAIALGVLVVLSVVRLFDWYERHSAEDFRSAVSFITGEMHPGDGVVISPSYAVKPIDFYLRQSSSTDLIRIPYRGTTVVADAPRIWLVTRSSDTSVREQRQIERNIASSRYGRVRGLPSFNGVDVRLFQARSAGAASAPAGSVSPSARALPAPAPPSRS